jgi:hypothetical protein
MKYKKTDNLEKNADQVNKILDETVKAFTDENMQEGIEGLRELAHLYKTAGAPKKSFLELCQYIENTAVERSGNEFLRQRMSIALREAFKAKSKIVLV